MLLAVAPLQHRLLLVLQILSFYFVWQCTALPSWLETSSDRALRPRQSLTTGQSRGGLHNPYHIPRTPVSLKFNTITGPSLNRVDTMRTFYRFRRAAQKHIDENGDTPIPPKISMGVHSVRLEVERRSNEMGGYPLTWRLATQAVKGVSLKMYKEGFEARTCIVQLLGDEEVMVGFVKVGLSG